MKLFLVFVLFIFFLLAPYQVQAELTRKEVIISNVVGTGVMTIVSGLFHQKVHSFRDVLNCFVAGATAGYGFYEARELISRGRGDEGMALTWLASSVSENASLGENWLAYLRGGVGPVEIRLATPLAKKPDSIVSLDVDAMEAVTFIRFLSEVEVEGIRNGVVYGSTSKGCGNFSAWTLGRSVGICSGYEDSEEVWAHEFIHSTQAWQWQSFGAHIIDQNVWSESKPRPSLLGFGFRLGWMNAFFNQIDHQNSYENRWSEKEAYYFSRRYQASSRTSGRSERVTPWSPIR